MLPYICIHSANAEDITEYFDTAPKAMPANLITSASVLNNNGGNASMASVPGVGYKYTATEKTQNNPWNVFCPTAFYARNSKGTNTAVNLDYYKAGTTYVYTAKVKNVSEDTTLTPYYGIAIPTKNTYSYNDATGSNEYGKDGMAVTSTDWMDFKATITFPDDWNEESTSTAVGQKIFAGIGKKSDLGSAVTVSSAVGDSLYLAEEIAYGINIHYDAELVYGEELRLVQNGSITLNAEIVNQIGIPGTLEQDIKWAVVSEDRQSLIDNITAQVNGNTVTLSCDETLPEGRYAAVAISEQYDIVKGIEFDVVEDLSGKYGDFIQQGTAENLIQKPGNSGFAAKSSANIQYTAKTGYVTVEALDNIESGLGVEGLKVRTVGANGLPSSCNFEPGKRYIIKARVRNPKPEIQAYFNASISNGTPDTLALTTEYGNEGMLLTEEWQEFNASISVSENYNREAAAAGRDFRLGFTTGTLKGAQADIELSVSLEEELLMDFTNEIIGDDNILTPDKALTLRAEMINQQGLSIPLPEDLSWVALTRDRTSEVEGFIFTANNDGTVTVSALQSAPAGSFIIAAYSESCNAAKGVLVTVKHEKLILYVSPDGSDSADGSRVSPLATLNGAKAFVRGAIKNGAFEHYSGIDVVFMPGEYSMETTAVFTEEDSGAAEHPITYKANGKVVFKGAIDIGLASANKVTDETVLARLNENVRNKVIELDISDYPHDLTQISLYPTNQILIGGNSEYPEIYLDGAEQNLAQWPNGDGEFAKYRYVVANDQFRYDEFEPAKWNANSNWWIGGFTSRDYDYKRMPGVNVDAANKIITVNASSSVGFSYWRYSSKRWKAYNLLEELDEVGEWYINAEAKKIYYFPPQLTGNERLEISCLVNNMISMRGTEYVSFEGFEFEKTRAGAITARDIKNINISGCTFKDIGTNAFYCTGSNAAQTDRNYWERQQIDGAYDCTVENCVFNNIGAYAIYLSGGNVDTLRAGSNAIRNNIMYKCAQKVRGFPAIYLGGCGNILEKNNISNLPFEAVKVFGNDHIIRYNEIYDVCRETEDCAAIYQGRNTVQRGTVVEYNYFHDLYPLYDFDASRYFNAAIYWDDCQTGMTVRNNIIRNAKLGIFNNGGVDNSYSGNTIIDTYMPMQIDIRGAAQNSNDTSSVTGFAGYIADPDLYYGRYENLREIIETDPIQSHESDPPPANLAGMTSVEDNLFVNSGKAPVISEYCTRSGNERTAGYGDFVNTAAQDYRIKLGSDTYNSNNKLLNESFDIELIGADEDDYEIDKSFELYYPYGRIPASDPVRFIWSEAAGAVGYRIEISQSSDFSDIIYTDTVSFNYADVPGIDVSADKYYWRVTAINSSRNMAEEWISKTGEFYCGDIHFGNVSAIPSDGAINITADITNEAYTAVPSATLYAACYSADEILVDVYKYDVDFTSSEYEFRRQIRNKSNISYISLLLWEDIYPLADKSENIYINH